MRSQGRASLLALSALMLFTSTHRTASLPSAASGMRGRNESRLSVQNGQRPRLQPGEEASPVCAYRVIQGGIWGQLCFRRTLLGYRCAKEDCRTRVVLGSLVANLLTNRSVLLQWSHNTTELNRAEPQHHHGSDVARPRPPRPAGFELSCWWNGSYTQFECAGVQLAAGCRDFLLSELHESIPYRICLRQPDRGAARRDCVEFTLPPSGMQDIVIAMTAVGGAICVMLVIICLLVAYITENIMSPAGQHSYPYRSHSRH